MVIFLISSFPSITSVVCVGAIIVWQKLEPSPRFMFSWYNEGDTEQYMLSRDDVNALH